DGTSGPVAACRAGQLLRRLLVAQYETSPRDASPWGSFPTEVPAACHRVVSLQRAGKYQRPAWRASQGQKGLYYRVVRASQWPSLAWRPPRRGSCVRTSSALAPSPCRFPPLCVLTPPLAGATAAPDTARALSGSRHDRSTRRPSLAYRGA